MNAVFISVAVGRGLEKRITVSHFLSFFGGDPIFIHISKGLLDTPARYRLLPSATLVRRRVQSLKSSLRFGPLSDAVLRILAIIIIIVFLSDCLGCIFTMCQNSFGMKVSQNLAILHDFYELCLDICTHVSL